MKTIDEHKCFDGWQRRYSHASACCDCEMTFSVYLPPAADDRAVPAVYFLSGLTCTDENFVTKAGAQQAAAELGLALVVPDTSPRGHGLPGEDESYDFGSGAGFYVNATEAPWAGKYNMYDYVVEELPQLIATAFDGRIDVGRCSVMGHSMGGHGALTIALRNPETYKSVSAFSPIVAPGRVPWGQKAFGGYLGADRATWRAYDATALVEDGHRFPGRPLIEQGLEDNFLEEQLRPELLEAACDAARVPLIVRRRPDYDHSYFFIASFVSDHLRFHGRALLG